MDSFVKWIVLFNILCFMPGIAYGATQDELIVGKWTITDKSSDTTKANGHYEKATWLYSYHFKTDGHVVITDEDESKGPFPYRIEGSTLFIIKYGLAATWDIVEVSNTRLAIKSPFYITRFKRDDE